MNQQNNGSSDKFAIVVRFTQREIDWLNNYAGNHDLGIEATVRHAVRMLSMVDGTPGAREALDARTRATAAALNASPPKEATRED